jgi:hypothetical protein
MQEGVFMGNIFTLNPPQAYYAKGAGFRASIPGRLGASSNNPYKPWAGYRPDSSTFYSGVADAICYQNPAPDGIHWEYSDCRKSDYAYGPFRTVWQNIVTTYVNKNYDSRVTQNFYPKTVDFNAEPTGAKTNATWEVYTHNGFDFHNSVRSGASGQVEVVNANGRRELCVANLNHIVITKNGGEPFSLTDFYLESRFKDGSGRWDTINIRGYRTGTAPMVKTTANVNWSGPGGAKVTTNWDGLMKVEIESNNTVLCIDDIRLKT